MPPAPRLAMIRAMDWQDEGILLAARRHGETAAILEVFTPGHGRHLGVLPGGASRKKAAILQPGTQLRLTWRARLDSHIGNFSAEPLVQRSGILSAAATLHALGAITTLLHLGLPERQPHPNLFPATCALLDALDATTEGWPLRYLNWERLLLDEMGYGLDLATCAVTGTSSDLAYVSPRTGRAIARSAAGDWAPRLLPLPPLLLGQGPATPEALAQSLAVTGHFLESALASHASDARPLPQARARLVRALSRA